MWLHDESYSSHLNYSNQFAVRLTAVAVTVMPPSSTVWLQPGAAREIYTFHKYSLNLQSMTERGRAAPTLTPPPPRHPSQDDSCRQQSHLQTNGQNYAEHCNSRETACKQNKEQ